MKYAGTSHLRGTKLQPAEDLEQQRPEADGNHQRASVSAGQTGKTGSSQSELMARKRYED